MANANQVLVVDDNIDVVESLSALLQCHGYETTAAHNGYAVSYTHLTLPTIYSV